MFELMHACATYVHRCHVCTRGPPDMHDCRAHTSAQYTRDGNLQALMRMAFQGLQLLTSVPMYIITTINLHNQQSWRQASINNHFHYAPVLKESILSRET